MGGMRGGGMRSVPPTSLPYTTVKAHQTRHLPTGLVSLGGPQGESGLTAPAKGERLRVGDVAQVTNDGRTQRALRRLAEEKAPASVAQLVLWNVAAGLDWETIARDSKGWANDHERALAQKFVAELNQERVPLATNVLAAPPDNGRLYWSLTSEGEQAKELSQTLRSVLDKQTVLGLAATEEVPARPDGPALAWRGTIDETKITIRVESSDAAGASWMPMGEFILKRKAGPTTTKEEITRQAIETADEIAAGVLGRLVRVQLSKPKRVQDKLVYQLQIANDSPLILNGLALIGPEEAAKAEAKTLAGFSLPPHKTMNLPATSDTVQKLGLKEGVRVIAVNLSGL
jgi:hypothetical protein